MSDERNQVRWWCVGNKWNMEREARMMMIQRENSSAVKVENPCCQAAEISEI